jgi:DNA replication protein DnaC
MAARSTTAKPKADLAFLCRALKAPSLAASYEGLADRARSDGWSFEDYLAACLEREIASRQDHGGEIRIRSARFPARKTLEEFDFAFQRSLKRDQVLHLGTPRFRHRTP